LELWSKSIHDTKWYLFWRTLIGLWQEPASRQFAKAENNVMVFKETKIKNIKITDAKPSTIWACSRMAEVRRRKTIVKWRSRWRRRFWRVTSIQSNRQWDIRNHIGSSMAKAPTVNL
jgi:hypothetical protein